MSAAIKMMSNESGGLVEIVLCDTICSYRGKIGESFIKTQESVMC